MKLLMTAVTAESLLDFTEGVGPGLRGLEAKVVLQQLDQQYEAHFTEWTSHWNDLVDFEIIAVRTSQEAAAAIAKDL